MSLPHATEVVAAALDKLPVQTHGSFLREILAVTAAGLVVIEDPEKAAEACYRTGDAVVARHV